MIGRTARKFTVCAALVALVPVAARAEDNSWWPAASSKSSAWTAPWKRPKVPSRLNVIWTDTVLNQGAQRGVRGFGGRLMFYTEDGDHPVRVAGRLVVYAFRDGKRPSEHCSPDRCYVFPPDKFPQHYSKSRIGHSYSVWIPWDEVGGYTEKLALVCRFEPEAGGVVLSEATEQILPGLARKTEPAAGAAPLAAQHAPESTRTISYESAATMPIESLVQSTATARRISPTPGRMHTTTIDVSAAATANLIATGHIPNRPGRTTVGGETHDLRTTFTRGGLPPAASTPPTGAWGSGGVILSPEAAPIAPPGAALQQSPPGAALQQPAPYSAAMAGAQTPVSSLTVEQLLAIVRQQVAAEQATAPAAQEPPALGSGFRPRPRRVLGAPIVQPRPDRGQSAPFRAGWPGDSSTQGVPPPVVAGSTPR